MPKPTGKQSNIIINCSDPRVIKWLQNKSVMKNLSIEKGYSEIANTGSIKYFLHERMIGKIYAQLEILVSHFKPEKIIILDHTHCGYYQSIKEDKIAIYIRDLKNAKARIAKKFPVVKVESWLIETESGKLKLIP